MIDPEASLLDKYMALTTRDGLRLHYAIDTHTHADHFSGSRALAQKLGLPVVMHRGSPAPFVDMHVDDGDMVTSAGVSAGIDMALHLVARLAGTERARETRRYIQYDPHPPV